MAQYGRVYQDAAEKKCFNDVLKQLSLQRTASSSSLGSVDASSVELKRGNSGSLIDFNAHTGPSATAAPMQTFARPPKATNPFDQPLFIPNQYVPFSVIA
ncbi:hypothetical protein Syun_011282 [Stephania yunnanensis]|uniref:Uncharacterized protein n=1 Tax=Stephania yunnanensis TaxID=152371 RepID=A0AAP0JXA0_9MAGN